MMHETSTGEELDRIYRLRFEKTQGYRKAVWGLISQFFQRYIHSSDTVLDLGCGYGEFISQIHCAKKLGMDMNPDSARHLDAQVRFLNQDCSKTWDIPPQSVDVIFTSNYFEHLPSKDALARTLDQACRCLRDGGRLIALGPNIKLVPGAYWDFWDHYIPLTELSLSEALKNHGFGIERCLPAFLPYTMSDGRRYPLIFLRIYLALPWLWKIFGRQFLIVALKKG